MYALIFFVFSPSIARRQLQTLVLSIIREFTGRCNLINKPTRSILNLVLQMSKLHNTCRAHSYLSSSSRLFHYLSRAIKLYQAMLLLIIEETWDFFKSSIFSSHFDILNLLWHWRYVVDKLSWNFHGIAFKEICKNCITNYCWAFLHFQCMSLLSEAKTCRVPQQRIHFKLFQICLA